MSSLLKEERINSRTIKLPQEVNEELRLFAEGNGWQFDEKAQRIQGYIENICFELRWSQIGISKGVHNKRQFIAQIQSPYELKVTRNLTFSGHELSLSDFCFLIPYGKTRTGDRTYDCVFTTRFKGVGFDIPEMLRHQHLLMPANVHLANGKIELSHIDIIDPDLYDVQQLLNLARVWIMTIRGERIENNETLIVNDIKLSYGKCLLYNWGSLFLWIYLFVSFLPVFFIHAEETNIAWSMSWTFLAPVSLGCTAIWIIWRWYNNHSFKGVLTDATISAFVIFTIWITSGPWIITWNTMVGPQEEIEVVGPVVEKIVPSGRTTKSRLIVFYDVKEQRNVKVRINPGEYEKLRLGDTVGFRFIKGSLGIYYNK